MTLLTVADAKTTLAITASTYDAELALYVDAVGGVDGALDAICGPIENRSVTEVVNGGGIGFALHRTPVQSITTVTPVITGAPTVDTADLDIDTPRGVVRSKTEAAISAGPLRVVYVAGRGTLTAGVQASVNLAGRIILKHLWETRRGGTVMIPGESIEELIEVPSLGYAIPRRAVDLLAPLLRGSTGPTVTGFA